MINGLIGGAMSSGWAPGKWTGDGHMAAELLSESDPTKNPQPLSLYVFLFLVTALALLLISMITHMKRARRNLGQLDTQSKSADFPPKAPSGGPREAG